MKYFKKKILKLNNNLLRVMCSMLRNKGGFSLIEVLAVVSIVAIGLLGISSLSLQNVQVQNMNNEELIASMLAQEGVELTRNIRDGNWINLPYEQWADNVLTRPITEATSTIDYLSQSYNIGNLAWPYDIDARLYFDASGEYYIHNGVVGDETKFYRYIETSTITETGDVDDAVKVICHVNWRSGGRDHTYAIESHLYHWR